MTLSSLTKITEVKQLTSLLPPVLDAPKTAMDLSLPEPAHGLPPLVLKYLAKNVEGTPWLNHLTLALLILAARNFDESSLYAMASLIHSKLKLFFSARKLGFHIITMTDFNQHIDDAMLLYLRGRIGPRDSQHTRTSFYVRYKGLATTTREWYLSLPVYQRTTYESFLFAPPNAALHKHLVKQKEITETQQRRRKTDTDALMPIYPELRKEAHLRWNFMTRLRNAYRAFLHNVDSVSEVQYPVLFEYEDADLRYEFALWSADAFMQANNMPPPATSGKLPTRFVALNKITNIKDHSEVSVVESIWFAELLRFGLAVDKNGRSSGAEQEQWLKDWGYARTAFNVPTSDLLYWRENAFMQSAQGYSAGLLIPIEQLYRASAFGVLAIDLFTTTGIRLNEAMQISLDQECLVRLVLPVPPGAKQKKPSIRYTLRLVPKGQRKNEREDNFIGTETKRLLFNVAKMLEEHYALGPSESLPSVPFTPSHRRAHRFGQAPYIFQLHRKQLPALAIAACIKFLLHGMNVRTVDGKMIAIRPHLLRHGFATHAVQVEKIPVDIVGRWLHQKTIGVTDYYSRATDTMVADAADYYLTKVAEHLDVAYEVQRSPEQLSSIYDNAIGRTGTLAKVVGGDCASHGLCKAQLACIGCAAKLPDPEMRNQVLHQRTWAVKEITFYRKEGLLPEVRRLEKMVNDADTELREMDMIEEYRRDEQRAGMIRRKND